MAAPGAASAGQPGRRAGHRYAAADPGTGRRPPAGILRAVLYGHAFNARRRCRAPGPDTASALAWVERASLPVSQLGDPRVIRAVLDGLCTRLDGSPAAANTITRKRAVFNGALGYAVERGLLPANPIGLVRWRARPEPPRPSARLLSPARRRSGRSWARSPASSRSWRRSSAAWTTRRCARKKPSPCAARRPRVSRRSRTTPRPPTRRPRAPGRAGRTPPRPPLTRAPARPAAAARAAPAAPGAPQREAPRASRLSLPPPAPGRWEPRMTRAVPPSSTWFPQARSPPR